MECLFEHVTTTQSTNQDLMDRWRKIELIHPISRLADQQTSGKGRRGNHWVSEPHHSLTFSLAYPFAPSTHLPSLQPLSLVVGIAILEGIALYGGIPLESLRAQGLGLKWPNDIYFNNAKLGGILIESGQKNSTEPLWTIIGIGLNIHHLATPIESDYAVGSLDALDFPNKKSLNTKSLWEVLSHHLLSVLGEFERQALHFDPLRWNDLHVFHQQEVSILEGHQIVHSGKIIGVNSIGALLLETPIGLQTVFNGNVSLRNRE